MASLHDRLISHAHFFDSTLNLIPTDVYFPKELSEEQILNAKFMKVSLFSISLVYFIEYTDHSVDMNYFMEFTCVFF